MTLQSKSFTISKGASLEQIAQFLEREIGLNAFLIRGIKGVSLSTDVTQLTVLYEKYSPEIVDSIAPREGALFTTGVSSDDFDIRFLFNEPVDAQSIASGTFSIDGQPLEADKVFVDPTTNNYFLKISASGAGFQSNAFHTYQVNNSLRREDGSSYNYTPVGGYIFHGIASAHLGDYPDEYISRRRGKLAVGVVKLSKNINPQQGISEFLSQRQLSDNRLITYTPISTSTNTVDVYFIYIRTLEPQIISGFPLDNSLLPDVSAPSKVTFVFNTQLDSSKLAATTGLFSIEEGFTTSTDVPPENVTLLPDNQTVEIDTTSYFTSQRVYSILAKPGIRSLEGLDKEKPEQWTVHIAPYEASGGTTTGVSQQDFDDFRALFDAHTGDPSIHYETGDILLSTGQVTDLPPIIDKEAFIALSGAFTGHTGEAFVSLSSSVTTNTSNLAVVSGLVNTNTASISTNVSNIETNTSDINSLSADFTGHTGINSIHYTQSEITNLNVNQLAPGSEGYILTVDEGSASWQPATVAGGGITTGEFTGHTGDLTIHYAQSDIFLDPGQINTTDAPSGYFLASTGGTTASFQPAPAGAVGLAGLSGDFTGHTGETGIHYLMDEIEILVDQVTDFNPADYTTNAAFGVHTGSGEVHFLESDISHFNISDIGTNTHAQIDTHIGDTTSNPHSVTPALIGAATSEEVNSLSTKLNTISGLFTGHSGETGIHFTINDIEITTDQITDINQYALDSEVNSLSAKVDDISGNYTGHTGETAIHFEVTDILLDPGQIDTSDVPSGYYLASTGGNTAYFEPVPAASAGDPVISGLFTGHTGETGIHFSVDEIFLGVDQLNPGTDAGYVLTSNGSTASWSPPPAVSGVSSGVFAAHTGNAGIHFLEGDINHLNITNIGVNSHAAIDTHIADMTGHTGETGIHFTQGEISIDTSQLTDFDVADFTGHTGETSIHFTQAEISNLAVSQLDGSEGVDTYVITTNGTTASWQPPSVLESEFNSLSGTVDTNTNSISTNTTFIAANSGDILTNINNISTNTTAIAANSGDLVSAVANIAINSGEIASNTTAISANSGDILDALSKIAANSGDIITNINSISTNVTAIAANSGDIIANENYITNVSGQLNAADINQNFLIFDNATNIAINSGAIVANSGDLVLAVADIAINSGEIINNTTAIAANSGDLLVTINDIAINSGEIVTNAGNISTNTTAIAANSGDIIENETYITNVSGQLNTKISTNTTAIAANSGDLLVAISDIATNTTAIAANSGDIQTNVVDIASNLAAIQANSGDILTNISDISANTAAIAANSGDIIENETYTTNVSGQLNTRINGNYNLIAAQNTYILANLSAHQANSGDLLSHTSDNTIHFTKNSISVSDLSEINDAAPASGDIIRYDGTNWSVFSTGGEEALGAETPIEDLQNVFIDYDFSGTQPTSDDLSDATGFILGWNQQSGQWTDFQLYPSSTIQYTISQGTAGSGPALGGNTILIDVRDLYPTKNNNLSDISNIEEARKNLKVRYQIEDIADYGLLRSARNVGGGSSYLVNPDAFTFIETDPMTFGIMTSTNAGATAATAGNARYSDRVAYLVNDFEYYFRVAINRNTNIKVRFGMGYQFNTDETVTGLCPHAIYFEYDSTTDTNWHACATNASTITRVDTNYAATANQWEWMGFMPVSSGVYFFEYQNGTTTGEAQHIAFISSTLMPQAGFKGQRVFVGNIGNGQTFGHMLIDKFAYPLYLDYLPSGLAARF